jgi:ABC-type Fe3+-citrate transport system substrate-binding protein
MHRHIKLLIVTLAAVGLLLAAGCGQDDEERDIQGQTTQEETMQDRDTRAGEMAGEQEAPQDENMEE